ncbi:Protein kinase, partial [Phytophthora megakarya]
VGAIRWKAPELIRKDKPLQPNVQSDIYAFGMCVVEAITGDIPWGPKMPDSAVKFHVTRKKFLPRPTEFDDAHWNLVERLCAFEPSERIKLSEAIEVLRSFAATEKTLPRREHVSAFI